VGWSWITLCRDVSTLVAYHDSESPFRNYVGQVCIYVYYIIYYIHSVYIYTMSAYMYTPYINLGTLGLTLSRCCVTVPQIRRVSPLYVYQISYQMFSVYK